MSHLTSQPIDASALVSAAASAELGALVSFEGRVRNHHAGRDVVSMEYTAYGAMADAICAAIVRDGEQRWHVRIALMHRLGALSIGDCAVVVAVGAGHREAAFDACRWVIDEVKRRAPIWKREQYADGSEAWVDPTAPDAVVPSMP